MLDDHLRAVPVQIDGRCVGLLTRHDVLREVARGTLQSEERWRLHAGMAGRDRG
jgi:predicted transcriptional regulator